MAAAVGTIPPQPGVPSPLQQQQHEVQQQNATSSSVMGGTSTSVANPPPGFSGVLSNFDTNAKPSWLLQGNDSLNQPLLFVYTVEFV